MRQNTCLVYLAREHRVDGHNHHKDDKGVEERVERCRNGRDNSLQGFQARENPHNFEDPNGADHTQVDLAVAILG
jgi:hypothetical protein